MNAKLLRAVLIIADAISCFLLAELAYDAFIPIGPNLVYCCEGAISLFFFWSSALILFFPSNEAT